MYYDPTMNMRMHPRAAGMGATRIVHQGLDPRSGINQPGEEKSCCSKKIISLKINSHLSPPRLEKTPLEHSALESPQQNRGQWWPWWWWRWWRQSLRRKIGWWWEGSADSWSLWGRWRWGRSRWRASSSWKIHLACTGNLRTTKLYNVYVDSTV